MNKFLAPRRRSGKLTLMMSKRFVAALLSVVALSVLHGAETEQAQPQVGQTAPDFSLPSAEGSTVNLKDFKGKWVVLYFYPKDFTSGCTLEAHNFERDLAKYQNESAIIVGVSADSAQSHKDFCAKEGDRKSTRLNSSH